MNFYNNTRQHYCGITLHARTLYVCIVDRQSETLLHKEIPTNPQVLRNLIEPYLDDLVIDVEYELNSKATHTHKHANATVSCGGDTNWATPTIAKVIHNRFF